MNSDNMISPEFDPDVNTGIWTDNGRRLIKILSFILILTVGLLLRLDSLMDWFEQPDLALYFGEPILTTFDGYYYLTLARDLMEGTYAVVDQMRAIPDPPLRPMPPPLMSILAAGVATLTPLSLNWVGVLLPAFLGVLLAFPMYGMGKHFGGVFMGLSTALISLVSPYYILRSGLGWFDTDCLLVTLVVSASWFFLKFGVISHLRRYAYLAAGLTTSLITVWWWDQTPQMAVILTSAPLLIALIFHYRPEGSEWRWLGLLGFAYVLVLLLWQGWRFPLDMVNSVFAQFSYVSKETTGLFPNIGITISEQSKMPLAEIIGASIGSPLILVLAVIGLLWLVIKNPKDALFLAVPVGLAVMAILFAGRFLIYVAPAVALGIGFLASRIWRMGTAGKPLMVFVAPILVVASALPGYQMMLQVPRFPHETPAIIEGMDYFNRHSEEDAVVWGWWDHGYPLNYWARRSTINDGQVHGGERSVYNGLPLVTGSERLSSNFMQFYVAHGIKGTKAFYNAVGSAESGYELLLKALFLGPEKAADMLENTPLAKDKEYWLKFLFPPAGRPVYLFLDWRLTQISYWWYWLGSWDNMLQQGMHPYHRTVLNVTESDGRLVSRGFELDIEKGAIQLGEESLMVGAFRSEGGSFERRDYEVENGVNVDYSAKKGMLVISDGYFSGSVFNQFFTYGKSKSSSLEVVLDRSPAYQIIKVHGDHYQADSK